MVQIQFALRANFQGAKPPGYPRRAERPGTFSLFTFLLSARQRPVILSEIRPPPRRASPGNYSLFIIHFSFACRAQVCNLVRVSAPSSSSPRRRRGAPRGGGEEEALVQTEPVPCFYRRFFCKVASVCKFGTNQNAPYFSFRCRSPGAHFTLGSPGAAGGAGWPRSGQTEGVSTGLRPAAHHFFTIHSYLLLLFGSPCGGAVTAQP